MLDRFRFLSLPGIALAAILLSGCGGNSYEGPDRYAVTGAATFGGQPITEGVINLVPTDGEMRRASGMIENGTYAITEEKGPNEGKYRVEITAYETVGEAGDEDLGSQSKQILPPQFNTQTTLEVDIVDGENVHDFNLTQ